MKWLKKGMIITANGQRKWMMSHIQNPYAVDMGGFVRVYFTSRPKPEGGMYRSVTAYLDLSKDDLSRVISISEAPLLDYGSTGEFDEFGIMPGAIVRRDDEYWLYYAGWQRMMSVPYIWQIGLAISGDGGHSFQKFGRGPIMSISHDDPFMLAAPRSVLYAQGQWHMLYGSGTGWIRDNDAMESMYLNRHAVSDDGINWRRDPDHCVATVYDDESQSACCSIAIRDTYHMFFPYRHSVDFRNRQRGYRIGYAWSKDLVKWVRDDDKAGIDVSEEGWDSEMICYPHVVRIGDRTVMFYCGNRFGCGGLGYAELVEA